MRRVLPLLGVLLLAGPAAAAMVEAPRPEALPTLPDRSVLLGVQVGAMLQDGYAIKRVYSRNDPLAVDVRATFLFEERFGFGVSGGLQFRRGTGVAPSGVEPAEALFWQFPIAVEGFLRMALWYDQIVVPFARFGATAVVWHEIDHATSPASLPVGVRFGPHAGGGAQFRLPFPEIDFEGRLSGPPLVDAVYVTVEGSVRSSSNLGAPGLDLSAAGISLGLTLLL
jgi:hypothetical protein